MLDTQGSCPEGAWRGQQWPLWLRPCLVGRAGRDPCRPPLPPGPSLPSGLVSRHPPSHPRLCPQETSKIVRVLCLCVSRTSNFWEHFPPCSLILLKMGGDKFPFMFHLENQTAWFRIPITSCVTLGKLSNLSVPPEP